MIKTGTPITNEHAKLIWLKRDCLESLVWARHPSKFKIIMEEIIFGLFGKI